jgi:hypothetical protein
MWFRPRYARTERPESESSPVGVSAVSSEFTSTISVARARVCARNDTPGVPDGGEGTVAVPTAEGGTAVTLMGIILALRRAVMVRTRT